MDWKELINVCYINKLPQLLTLKWDLSFISIREVYWHYALIRLLPKLWIIPTHPFVCISFMLSFYIISVYWACMSLCMWAFYLYLGRLLMCPEWPVSLTLLPHDLLIPLGPDILVPACVCVCVYVFPINLTPTLISVPHPNMSWESCWQGGILQICNLLQITVGIWLCFIPHNHCT